MKQFNLSVVSFFCILVLGWPSISYTCTDIILPFAPGSPIISARSMDFSQSPTVSFVTHLIKVPVGLTFKANSPIGMGKGHCWKNKYGFVAFSMKMKSGSDAEKGQKIDATKEFYSDGLNTAGLSVAANWLSYTDYEKVPPGECSKCIDAAHITGYLLGTCASIAEAQEKLDNVIVWFVKEYEFLDPMHLSIHDSKGKSLVVEFINGKKNYYLNDIGVLTNGPTFDWHAVHFNYFYNALTSKDNNIDKYVVLAKELSGLYKITSGKGYQYEVLSSGMFGLPGDSTSPSRFVRAGKLIQSIPTTYDKHEGVQYAVQVLGRISVCEQEVLMYFDSKGELQTPRNTYNTTLWMTIRNHTDKIVYYYTRLNHNIQAIKLNELDFSKGAKTTQTLISDGDWYIDSTSKLK